MPNIIHYVPFTAKEEGAEILFPSFFEGRAPFDDGRIHFDPLTNEPVKHPTVLQDVDENASRALSKSAVKAIVGAAKGKEVYVASGSFPERSLAKTYVAAAAFANEPGDDGLKAFDMIIEGLRTLTDAVTQDAFMVIISLPMFQKAHRHADNAIVFRCRVRFLCADADTISSLSQRGFIERIDDKGSFEEF